MTNELLQTKQTLLIQLEHKNKEVGVWTPVGQDGVIGEFQNHRSVTSVIRCPSQIESVSLPSQAELVDFGTKISRFQKGINSNDANG